MGKVSTAPREWAKLESYPTGTWISIGERVFRKIRNGTFWREEHATIGNRVSRPSSSLAWIEEESGASHVVFHKTEIEVFQGDVENLAQETCAPIEACAQALTAKGGDFNDARRHLLSGSI